MKIFDTDTFITERIKLQPITNAEWDNTRKYIKEMAIREITPINTRSALHWDCYCSDEKIHYDYESYDKWYMFQNENIILFWNESSEYYPFFFKTDIEDVMKFESYTSKALWHAIRAVAPIPDTPHIAYNKFVRNIDKYVRDYVNTGPYDFNVVKKIPEAIKEIINLYYIICLNKESKKIPFDLTKDDLKGMLEGMPMGIVVRMMEEQEKQGNFPVVKIFQNDIFAVRRLSDGSRGGFDWERSEAGFDFWSEVLKNENFNLFFEKYPEYRKYNLD